MGVPGLFSVLQPVSSEVILPDLRGLVLGVDGYGWLHRATLSCASDLVAGKPTAKFLDYFDKRIALFYGCGVKLYFVFDGDDLPIKQRINSERANRREAARMNLHSEPTPSVAKQALNVSYEIAAAVCGYLKLRGIPYVVAPFEADAQLVYLENTGVVDAILSEDSDLLIFGAKKLITKLKDTTATLVDFTRYKEDVPVLKNLKTQQSLRALAILSGCDYSPGIVGMGIIKSAALMSRAQTLENALDILGPQVTEEFRKKARTADLCFQFQRVWDVENKCLTTLSDTEETIPDEIIGHPYHTNGKAKGFVNPTNGERIVLHPNVTMYMKQLTRNNALVSPKVNTCDYRQKACRLFSAPASIPTVSPFFKSSAEKQCALLTPDKKSQKGLQDAKPPTLPTPNTSVMFHSDVDKENIPPEASPTPACRSASLPSPRPSPVKITSSKPPSHGDAVLFRTFSQSFSSRTVQESPEKQSPPKKRPALAPKLNLEQFAYKH